MKLRRRCKCGCGEITKPGKRWVSGHQNRSQNNHFYKHGLSNHKLHSVWKSMKDRCYNQNFIRYEDWGGRGVKVYPRWRSSFISFYNWAMAIGWEEGLQIDRIDNDGNYNPDNCRFVTRKMNACNRREPKIQKNHSTGYKGVCLYQGKYMARRIIDGKLKYLGYYHTAEEAAEAIQEYEVP